MQQIFCFFYSQKTWFFWFPNISIINRFAGITTHFVNYNRYGDLEKALAASRNAEDVAQTLNKFESESTKTSADSYATAINNPNFKSEIFQNQAIIKDAFSRKTVEQIVECLKQYQLKSEFAKKTVDSLNALSPTSLKVGFFFLFFCWVVRGTSCGTEILLLWKSWASQNISK